MTLTLWSYRYSVYGWIVRLALHAFGQRAAIVEIDPFADPPSPVLTRLHPFGRVPVLQHGDFRLYETAAILRYLDSVFDGRRVPTDPQAAARMAQVIGIADAYAYRPMVRQVFAQAVFGPRQGRATDQEVLAIGLAASRPVLAAFEAIAAEGLVLNGTEHSLADLHLAPMMAYFQQAPEGAAALAACTALSRWWQTMKGSASLAATDPGLP